jgi:hypothetical protein
MTSASWHRRSGLVTSVDGGAGRARGFLEGAMVVAVVETEPEYPDAVTVTLAVDQQDKVAVVDDARTAIVAGPSLLDLAQRLAEACGGRVTFDEVVVGTEPEPSEDHSDPFDPEIDVASAYVPDRSLVFTRADVAQIGELAVAVDRPVLVAPVLDGRLALVSDGPALSAVDWPLALQPALVVEQGAAYPAVAVIEDGASHIHTWDADATTVPSAADLAAVVRPLAEDVLGPGALVAEIGGMFPDADVAAVRRAIDGPGAGPAALIEALGFPQALVGFLGHGADVPQLDGAKLLQPDHFGHAFARVVTDASAQMTEIMREQAEQMRERAEHRAEHVRERAEQRAEHVRERAEQQAEHMRERAEAARIRAEQQAEHMRERAEAARLRAEAALDAAETFNEEVVVPIQQSWLTPAVAAVEAGAAAFLLHRSRRGGRVGTGATAGDRVAGVFGALLLVGAVANSVRFLAPRLKRDL